MVHSYLPIMVHSYLPIMVHCYLPITNARKITLRLLHFVPLKDYLHLLENLSNDSVIPKYATHVVYLTKSNDQQVETRIMDSIFSNPAKRADYYWFVNINRNDDPFTMEYSAEMLKENKVVRVDFNLGFRIQPKIAIMLKKVAAEMVSNNEITPVNPSDAMHMDLMNDFRFVILQRFLSYDNEFSAREGFILNSYFSIIKLARTDTEAYGIDRNLSVIENVPLVVSPMSNITLKRTKYKD
jgi:KUP system potassium uptake protein